MEDEIGFKFSDNNNFFEMVQNYRAQYIRRCKKIWLKIADYAIEYLDARIMRIVCGKSERIVHYIGRKCCTKVFSCRYFTEQNNFEMVKLYNDYNICDGYKRSWSWYGFKSTEMVDLMSPHLKSIHLIKTYNSMELSEMMNPMFQYILKYTSDRNNRLILSPEGKNFLISKYGIAGENFVREFWIDISECKTFVFAKDDINGILTLNGREKYYHKLTNYKFVADEIMKTYDHVHIAENALDFIWNVWKKTIYFNHRMDYETCKCCEWSDNYITILSNVLDAMKKIFPQFRIMGQQIADKKIKLYMTFGEKIFSQRETISISNENRVYKKFAQLIDEYNGVA